VNRACADPRLVTLILTAMRLASVCIHCAVIIDGIKHVNCESVHKSVYIHIKQGHYTTQIWLNLVLIVLFILKPLREGTVTSSCSKSCSVIRKSDRNVSCNTNRCTVIQFMCTISYTQLLQVSTLLFRHLLRADTKINLKRTAQN